MVIRRLSFSAQAPTPARWLILIVSWLTAIFSLVASFSLTVIFFLAAGAALVTTPARAADPVANDIHASVDRNVVYSDESLQLTLNSERAIDFSALNLEVLADDFQVAGRQQSQSHQYINGEKTANYQMQLSLFPRRVGKLEIPPLTVDGRQSRPITVTVLSRKALEGDSQPAFFLRTSLDKQSAYLQEQVRFTLQLFYAETLISGQLSEPVLADALIKDLEDQHQYQEVIDGKRYQVVERNYLIFPQRSGELRIPPQQFSGTAVNRLQGGRRLVNEKSDELILQVKPIPAAFTGKQWLPATDLHIGETWSTPPESITSGSSLTRTLTLEATQLEATQLPRLDPPHSNLVRWYPDQPVTEDTLTAAGIESRRTQAVAMLATAPGTLSLPEIRIPWWDTAADVQREVVIPARQITILPGEHAGIEPVVPVSPPASSNEQPPQPMSLADRTWQGTTALFALLWLGTLGLLARSRQGNKGKEDSGSRQPGERDQSEYRAFCALEAACLKQALPTLPGLLLSWCRHRYPDSQLNSPLEAVQKLGDAELARQFTRLDQYLYGAGAESLDEQDFSLAGKTLAARLKKIRKQPVQSGTGGLPPLYPASTS